MSDGSGTGSQVEVINSYCTQEDVRLLGGFTTEEIDSSTLASLIERANRDLFREVTVERINETLKPNLKGEWIDGVNRVFYLAHCPVADTNFDARVDASDLKVYAWADKKDEATRTEVAISEVNPGTGRLVLAQAPAATVQRLTADYAYYLKKPDFELFRKAVAFLAAYFAVLHFHARLPRRVHLPELTVFNDDIGQPFLSQYQRTLDRIRPLSGVSQ
ncbi:hypothetical protein M1N21_00305 [Dehalococcoidia bacterium]|nr:hypothetical protein [Dehalococcoidia bacterium]